MKLLISTLLGIALCTAQTIEITIPGGTAPGGQNSNGGGGGSSVGLVIGALVGLGISLLITNAVFGKAKPDVQKNGDKRHAFLPGYFIVVFEGPLDLSSLGEVEDKVDMEEGISFALIKADVSLEEFSEKVKALPKVLFWQPNYLYQTFDDPLKERQPYLKNTGQCEGKGIKIAILDTGADTEHQDLKTAFLRVENLLKSPYRAEEHGTAVASLIGARRNGVGMEGVAVQSELYLFRVCEGGTCYSFPIAKALTSLLRERVDVINMSFGMYGEDRLVSLLLERLSKRGVFITAPVGNEPGPLPFPASSPHVISVAGLLCQPKDLCEKAKAREPYKDLLVAVPGGYGVRSGTSLSSALHAGRLACKISEK